MTTIMRDIPATYDTENNLYSRTFNLEWTLAGRTYSARIKAHDWGDAVAHLGAIIESGRVSGEVIAEEI